MYLNRIYAEGKPAYEIVRKKMSIIYVGLTNQISMVKNFEVLPNCLGVNPQTCNKIIKLTIGLNHFQNSTEGEVHVANKFRLGSHEDIVEVREWVADRIGELGTIRPDDISIYNYSVLCRIYHFAKTKFLGFLLKRQKSLLLAERFKGSSSSLNITRLFM